MPLTLIGFTNPKTSLKILKNAAHSWSLFVQKKAGHGCTVPIYAGDEPVSDQPLGQPDARELFNCCTNYAEPDWSRFAYLEIGGCINDLEEAEEDSTHILGNRSAAEAEFFTIYGRGHDDMAEAITDVADARRLLQVAGVLALRSKLRCVTAASLG